MALDPSTYISPIWAPSLFTNRTVFCTGGNGTICSAQVRALIHLGANACIVGRNAQKTADVTESLKTARKGARVIGIGGVDVRDPAAVDKAVQKCVDEFGGIDYLMYFPSPFFPFLCTDNL